MTDLLGKLSSFFDARRIEAIGVEALAAVVILLTTFYVSRMLQRFIDRRLRQGAGTDEDTIRTYKYVTRFLIVIPGVLFALHVLGVNLRHCSRRAACSQWRWRLQ